MPEEQSEILLRYAVDRASVQEALAADKRIQEQLNKTGQTGKALIDINERLTKSIATELRAQAVDAISQEFQQVLRDTGDVEAALVRVKRHLRDIGASDDEIRRVGVQIANIRDQEQQQRSLGQNITRLGRGIFNAPAVGPSTPIARFLIGSGAVVDKLGIDLKTLAAGAGVTAIAVAAVALALDGFNKGLAENKKQLEGALAAQGNYYQALATLTSDQVDAQIRQLQQARPALEQQVQETRQALDSAFAQAQQTPLGDVGARVLFNQLPTGALQEAFDEAQRALNENIQTETRLTQGRESGAFAANDAAAAEQRLSQARLKALSEQLDADEARALLDLELSRQIREGVQSETPEEAQAARDAIEARLQRARDEQFAYDVLQQQVQRRIDDIQTAISLIEANPNIEGAARALEEANGALAIAQEQYDGYQDKLDNINRTIEILQPGFGLVNNRLQELNKQLAISAQTDNYFEALEREVEIRNEIAEATNQIAEFEAEAAAKLAQIAQDRNERLADLEEDKADRIETIAQNSADRIQKIQRDLGRSSVEAVAERDALAFHKAQQTAADALEDQQKADQRQLQQLDKTLDKQERTINRSYERQERNIQSSLAKQVQTQQVALQRLNVDLQNAQFAQQAIALDGSNRQRIIHTQMWQDVYSIAANWAVNISNVVGGILSSTINFAQQTQQPQYATTRYVERTVQDAFRTVYSGQRSITQF